MHTQTPPKETRLNIRIAPHQKDAIARAAQFQRTSVSDFVLEQACEAAAHILTDNAELTLTKPDFEAFYAALDAPPRDIPRLRKLMTTPSVFEPSAR